MTPDESELLDILATGIVVARDRRTGRQVAGCPLCQRKFDGFTARGALDALSQHSNVAHMDPPRVGHA